MNDRDVITSNCNSIIEYIANDLSLNQYKGCDFIRRFQSDFILDIIGDEFEITMHIQCSNCYRTVSLVITNDIAFGLDKYKLFNIIKCNNSELSCSSGKKKHTNYEINKLDFSNFIKIINNKAFSIVTKNDILNKELKKHNVHFNGFLNTESYSSLDYYSFECSDCYINFCIYVDNETSTANIEESWYYFNNEVHCLNDEQILNELINKSCSDFIINNIL